MYLLSREMYVDCSYRVCQDVMTFIVARFCQNLDSLLRPCNLILQILFATVFEFPNLPLEDALQKYNNSSVVQSAT